MNLSRVLDDQADAEEERHDRTRLPLLIDAARVAAEAAAQAVSRRRVLAVAVLHVPGARSDRRRDQLDDRRHVDLGPLARGITDAVEWPLRISRVARAEDTRVRRRMPALASVCGLCSRMNHRCGARGFEGHDPAA